MLNLLYLHFPDQSSTRPQILLQADVVMNALIAFTASPSCAFKSSVAFALLKSNSSTYVLDQNIYPAKIQKQYLPRAPHLPGQL